ncbi:3-hydroxybutyryl-CoA dehydrogenase [Bryocella elongata]|uniref:3-hydroxybutyryl-CoA dehydrogenase n=1 Tax=Bryocella elongata TaxID=863522 RepID=A0A1H5WVY7_9BACT|nr:3-hydroxyacyl-CoA dehydrogenase NAD-binding domain-containing protein [Bryocella elongata]SEG03749.1 3-hydroxybutyryl-CoA dehydrogenase [Bryocella elongata]
MGATSGISVKTIAVIGAGDQGRALAAAAARAGFTVYLEDVMPVKLRHAQEALGDLAGVHYVSTVEDAVHDADLAIDFVPDELESKLEIVSLLDRMAPPRTLLLIPTRALSITDLASCTYRAAQCVGVKPGDPDAPYRTNLVSAPVEIIRSKFVTEAALRAAQAFFAAMSISSEIVEDRLEPMLVKNQQNS